MGEFGKFFAINMASGGLAGAGSLCIAYPLDYARTRLASDVGTGKRQFNGLLDCLKKTMASSGVGGLYNGIGVSITGIIPYRGVYFGLFDTLSGYNPYQKDENGVIRAASKFGCAQFSAISAGYASYPFDTVRRRLQMQSEKPESEWVYKGTMDCFGKIVKEEKHKHCSREQELTLFVPLEQQWYWFFTPKLLLHSNKHIMPYCRLIRLL